MSPTVPSSGSLFRRLLVRAALVCVSLVVACLVAELVARLLGMQVPLRGDAGSQSIFRPVAADVALGVDFELIPGHVSSASYPGVGGEATRVVTYTVNELGFRGPSVAKEKPAGVYRIIALGDSFTYGTGVDDQDTWPTLLERELRSLAPDRPVEVLNWGVPAYNTRQEIALLNYRGPAYQPDLVLLCCYVNDASGEAPVGPLPPEEPEQAWKRRLGLTSGRWDDGAPMSPEQKRTMFLRKHSRVIDVLAYKLNGWLTGRLAERYYIADWQPGSPGLKMVTGALAHATVLSRRQGFELVALMYPDLPSLGSSYAFAEQHAVFAGLCEQHKLPFHDLTGIFDGLDPDALTAHAHDKHPNAQANALVARELARLLLPRLEAQ